MNLALAFDEQPVGQHKVLEIPELPPENPIEPPVEGLTLEEQLVHRNPKARFEASCRLVKTLSESAADFDCSVLDKLLADPHPGVQERALEALLILLRQKRPGAIRKETTMNIMEKCLASAKQVTRSKAIECLFIMATLPESELYNLIKGCITNKSSSGKLVAAVLSLLRQLLISFGDAKFPVKDILPQVILQTKSNNISVKNEAMEYLKEAQKQSKEEVNKVLHQLKASQQEELRENGEMAFKADARSGCRELSPSKTVEVANYHFLAEDFDEVWCSNLVQLKKWSEKRDKLEELQDSIALVKPGNVLCIANTLKDLLSDPNIGVVNLAVNLIGQLAKRFRDELSLFSRRAFVPTLCKCKDKKTIAEAKKCLENLAFSLKPEEILDDVKDSLHDKSPQVKVSIIDWITSVILPKSRPQLTAQYIKQLTPIISKLTDDATAEVRDAALSCLGTFKKHSADPSLESTIKEMNTQKQEKIRKASGVIDVAKLMEGARHNRVNSDLQAIKESEVCGEEKEVSLEDVGEVVSLEEAAKVAEEVLPKEIVAGFGASGWAERQRQFQDLKVWLRANKAAAALAEPLAVWVKLQAKDFKERNYGTIKEIVAALQALADGVVTKRFAFIVVPGVIERWMEPKLFEVVQELVLSISDSASPCYVGTLIVRSGYALKATSSLKLILNMLNKFIEEYTVKLMPLAVILGYAKSLLENPSPEVRSAATRVLEGIYSQLGKESKKIILADLKEVMHKIIEKQLDNKKLETAELRRKLRGEAETEAEEKLKAKDVLEKLMPRANVAALITPAVLSSLADPAMKVRQDAKNSLSKILAGANCRIAPAGLSSLIVALKSRMSEPCKNLAKEFISLLGDLIQAAGPGFRQYSKIILQPLMCNLTDKQGNIRNETLLVLDKFAETCGAEVVVNCMGPLLEKDNPELRGELLKWLGKKDLSKADNHLLITPLIAVMQDRSKEIRMLSEEVVGQVIRHVGYETFVGALQDLKPAVRSLLMEAIKKYEPAKADKLCEAEVMNEQGQLNKSIKIAIKDESNFKGHKNLKMKTRTRKSSDAEFNSQCITERDSTKAEKEPLTKSNKKTARKELHSPTKLKDVTVKKFNTTNKKTLNLQTEVQSTSSFNVYSPSAKSLQQKGNMQSSKCMSICDSLNRSQLSMYTNTDILGTSMVQMVIIETIGNKEKRAELDRKAKWPVNETIPGNVARLKKALKPAVHPVVFEYMFSEDFKRVKQAVALFKEAVNFDFNLMVDILDLLFKWITMQMMGQSSMSVSKGVVELLGTMFEELKEMQYVLMDFEAASILPILCEKLGVAHSGLKSEYKMLVEKTYDIYSVAKACGYLIAALESKNPRTKCESLLMINELVRVHGIRIIQSKDIKVLGRALASSAIKAGVTELLYQIYAEKGDKIWTFIGTIPEPNKEMLKQSFNISKVSAPVTPMLVDPGTLLATRRTLGSSTARAVETTTPARRSSIKLRSTQMPEEIKSARTRPTAQADPIAQCIELLNTSNVQSKLESLVLLHSEITRLLAENKEVLVGHCDAIFDALVSVVRMSFGREEGEVFGQFRKYAFNLLTKICSLKFLVAELRKDALFIIIEELLAKLLYERLEEMKEREYIVKALNLSVIRLVENSNPTTMFAVLFEMFQKYKKAPGTALGKLPSLVVKCILKLCKTFPASTASLSVSQALLVLHQYLCNNPFAQPRSHNDEIGIRIAKTAISELVKLKGSAMWEHYNDSVAKDARPDLHIKRWIHIVMKSVVGDELVEMFKGLTSKSKFDSSIKALAAYLQANPNIDIDRYLESYSVSFSKTILNALNDCMEKMKSEGDARMGLSEADKIMESPRAKNSEAKAANEEARKHKLSHGQQKLPAKHSTKASDSVEKQGAAGVKGFRASKV